LTVKVSVVVPVYNPGERIDGLLASLRRQSMPAEEFEVVFVDDGSTDGTGERLDRLVAEAPNMRVIHIPNSGWPGKPRNVGIEASRGEYVQLVDNDDKLGDEALERLYAYASKNGADVVVGKEIHHPSPPTFGSLFGVNRPRATLEKDPLLSLLTPHKMFRRAFLDEHGIRFFEGPRRLEDHPFVVEAYFRANVISVLSDYTCYYWVQHEDRAGIRPPDWAAWYGFLRDALDVVEEHTAPGRFRDRLLSHWYRTKGLARLGAGLARRSEEDATRLLEALYDLAEERFPPDVDAHLPGIMRVRSALLRAQQFDRIRALAEIEEGMRLDQTLEPLESSGGHLIVKATASLTYPDAEPVVLDAVGGRLYWRAPIDLGPHVSRETLDFTGEFQRIRLHVLARGRSSNEAFVLPGSSEPLAPLRDGGRLLGAARSAWLDPDTLMSGRSLSVEAWDLQVQLAACGWTPRKALHSLPEAAPRVPLGPVLSLARLVVPFTTVRGNVSLDVDQHSLSLLRCAPPAVAAARLRPTERGVRLVVPLQGLAMEGRPVVGRLLLRPKGGGPARKRPLRLVGDDPTGQARLVADLPLAGHSGPDGLPPGHWELSAAIQGRRTALDLVLVVCEDRRATLRTRGGREVARASPRSALRTLAARVPGAAAARRMTRRAGRALGP
jgi:glycosyltransferase involved in cell wall biosynthesis